MKVSNEWFCRPLERIKGGAGTKPASASFLEDWAGSPGCYRKHCANTSAPSLPMWKGPMWLWCRSVTPQVLSAREPPPLVQTVLAFSELLLARL